MDAPSLRSGLGPPCISRPLAGHVARACRVASAWRMGAPSPRSLFFKFLWVGDGGLDPFHRGKMACASSIICLDIEVDLTG